MLRNAFANFPLSLLQTNLFGETSDAKSEADVSKSDHALYLYVSSYCYLHNHDIIFP